MVTTNDTIVGLVKEGLELWKVFISTRQEAYDRKMDKRQKAAIAEGEKAVNLLSDIFTYLYFKDIFKDDKKMAGYKRSYLDIKARFNKYD